MTLEILLKYKFQIFKIKLNDSIQKKINLTLGLLFSVDSTHSMFKSNEI